MQQLAAAGSATASRNSAFASRLGVGASTNTSVGGSATPSSNSRRAVKRTAANESSDPDATSSVVAATVPRENVELV